MGKGAGKGKGKKKEPEPEDTGPPPPPPDLNSYVSLSLKLMNWKFMDDSTIVTDETHLFTIKKKTGGEAWSHEAIGHLQG